jgi:hypothetical protein
MEKESTEYTNPKGFKDYTQGYKSKFKRGDKVESIDFPGIWEVVDVIGDSPETMYRLKGSNGEYKGYELENSLSKAKHTNLEEF